MLIKVHRAKNLHQDIETTFLTKSGLRFRHNKTIIFNLDRTLQGKKIVCY